MFSCGADSNSSQLALGNRLACVAPLRDYAEAGGSDELWREPEERSIDARHHLWTRFSRARNLATSQSSSPRGSIW